MSDSVRMSIRRPQPEPPSWQRIELGSPTNPAAVVAAAPPPLLERVAAEPQRGFPAIAKEPEACAVISRAVQSLPSAHLIHLGDSRRLELAPDSVELVVTSPPYWTLKEYNDQAGQLGQVEDYEEFLDELDAVWRRVHRALVPGGRMVVVVGDVNVSRKAFGRHLVFPLHASIQERCRVIGFDNLAPIIWHKIANAKYEMGAGGFYGKPTSRMASSRTTSSTSCCSASPADTASPSWPRGSCRSFQPKTMRNGSSRSGVSTAPRRVIIPRPFRSAWPSV